MMKVNAEQIELAIWHGTDSSLEDGNLFRSKSQLGADGRTPKSITIDVKPNKELASALGLSPKKDKDEVEEASRDLSDALKAKMGAEVAGILSSPLWTGVRIKATKNKAGVVTKTLVFKSVKKKKGITIEQIAAAYGFTVEDAEAMILRQMAILEEKEKATHNVEGTVTPE